MEGPRCLGAIGIAAQVQRFRDRLNVHEVPVMLSVVRIVKGTRGWYEAGSSSTSSVLEVRRCPPDSFTR